MDGSSPTNAPPGGAAYRLFADAPLPHLMTALSRRPASGRLAAANVPRISRGFAVARASLCLLFAMSLPACLVTSSPTFEEPERTPPFLIAPSARPDLRQIKVVDTSSKINQIDFSAAVRSEDNGDDLYARLVLDYGVMPPGGPGFPYQQILFEINIDPGTLNDTIPRTITTQWFFHSNTPPEGCHTATLFATHEIDLQTGCPADPTDFNFLTWTVFVCNQAMGSCCDPTMPPDKGGCKSFVCPDADPDVRCDTVTSPASARAPISLAPGEDSSHASRE